MNAGTLNEHIEIFSSYLKKNDVGEQQQCWNRKNVTKARIIHNSGNRNIENNEVVYNYVKTFEVRIYVDIDEFDRIKWNGKFYRVLNIDRNKELQKITIQTELVNE